MHGIHGISVHTLIIKFEIYTYSELKAPTQHFSAHSVYSVHSVVGFLNFVVLQALGKFLDGNISPST